MPLQTRYVYGYFIVVSSVPSAVVLPPPHHRVGQVKEQGEQIGVGRNSPSFPRQMHKSVSAWKRQIRLVQCQLHIARPYCCTVFFESFCLSTDLEEDGRRKPQDEESTTVRQCAISHKTVALPMQKNNSSKCTLSSALGQPPFDYVKFAGVFLLSGLKRPVWVGPPNPLVWEICFSLHGDKKLGCLCIFILWERVFDWKGHFLGRLFVQCNTKRQTKGCICCSEETEEETQWATDEVLAQKPASQGFFGIWHKWNKVLKAHAGIRFKYANQKNYLFFIKQLIFSLKWELRLAVIVRKWFEINLKYFY